MIYIVALGNGFILKDNVLNLTPESKITVLSAGILYKKGFDQKIIFSGGHTKGKNKESEAKMMFDLLKNKFPEIPDASIILEENSLDTAGNAFEVKKLLPKDSKVILLSFAYHLKRAKKIFHNFNIDFGQVFASEVVLKQFSPEHDEYLNKFTIKRKLQRLITEVLCLFLVYTIDPKEKILRVITSQRRGN